MLKLIVALCCVAFSQAKHVGQPNVLVLLVDDLGIADLGCFGNESVKTPHIDRLAAEGAKLLHNLAPESICTPSRAAFLTGRYAVRSGLAANPNKLRMFMEVSASGGLPQNETTLAEILTESGYKTGLIGKWHLGLSSSQAYDYVHHPLRHGFQSFYGVPLTNLRDCGGAGESVIDHILPGFRPYFILSSGLTLLMLALALHSLGFISRSSLAVLVLVISMLCSFFIILVGGYGVFNCLLMQDFEIVEQPIQLENLTVKFTNEAIRFIRKNRKEPFLLFMSFCKVHTALFTSKPFRNHSGHSEYLDNVEELDWSVGQIMDTITTLGLKEDTFVFLTSDNGPHLEEMTHGGWKGIYKGGKAQSWEGGIRVPTIVSWPSHIPQGVEITEPTSSMDLFSTILSITGHPGPKDRAIDGKDIMPLLTQKLHISPHEFMFHYCAKSIHAVRYRPRTGHTTWKVHYMTPKWSPGTQVCYGHGVCHCYGQDVNVHQPPLLFDITQDPSESSPVDASSSIYKRVMESIDAAVMEHTLGVTQVPDQLDRNSWNPTLQQCCNFPYCSCTEPEKTLEPYPGV